jgi:hypothetical protein
LARPLQMCAARMLKSKIAITLMAGAALSLLATSAAHAQVLFEGYYSQNFNGLPTTGTLSDGSAVWTDENDTIGMEGWYASLTTIGPTTGSGNLGNLKSYGASGSTERSLGSLVTDSFGSVGVGAIYYGVYLFNLTGEDIMELNISYWGEQWRRASTTEPQRGTLTLEYSYDAEGITPGAFTNPVGYSALDFVAPIASSTATATALDGNAAANRTYLSSTLVLSTPWEANTGFWLRWTDINDPYSDNGLGIDDLVISVVPEPGAGLPLAAAALGAFVLVRRRRR